MKEIYLRTWDWVIHDEELGAEQLNRLIDRGVFPKPISIPVSTRTAQRYFPSHELAARRAVLLKTDGDEVAVKAVLEKLHRERNKLADDVLVTILGDEGVTA